MRLKVAIMPFMKATMANRLTYVRESAGRDAAPKNAAPIAMLMIGPAIDIFAISSIRAGPEIITAPGEISLIGETIEIRVIMAPHVVRRNSAHKPLFWAVILCAISCIKNEAVKRRAKTDAMDQFQPK